MPLAAGDVYFDIRSIGDRYGKFVGAVDSQGEPGKCLLHSRTVCVCVCATEDDDLTFDGWILDKFVAQCLNSLIVRSEIMCD